MLLCLSYVDKLKLVLTECQFVLNDTDGFASDEPHTCSSTKSGKINRKDTSPVLSRYSRTHTCKY